MSVEVKSPPGLWSTLVKDFQRWYPMQSAKEVATNALFGIAGGVGLYAVNARMEKYMKPFPASLKGKRSPLNWAIECLIFPALEESLYRGIIKENQVTRQSPESPTEKCKNMIVNSAIFSAAHIRYGEGIKRNIAKMPFYLLAGCVLWQLADVTNTLWSSTIAHGASNALSYSNRKTSLGSAILARKI
jgi:membrane protease YdiL (CAAX protease family)